MTAVEAPNVNSTAECEATDYTEYLEVELEKEDQQNAD
jgi:hypothetical protein